MAELDAMQTLAQLGVALAGFTSVVVVFRRDESDDFHPADRFRVFSALMPSLIGTFIALIPVGLDLVGVAPPTIWRASSFILATVGMAYLITNQIRFRRLPPEARAVLSRGLGPLMDVLHILPILVGLVNGFGIFLPPQGGLYFFGVLSMLVLGAIVFARVVFVRPAA